MRLMMNSRRARPTPQLRNPGEVEGAVRVADVHHDLDRDLRQRVQLDLLALEVEQALVDVAGVALGARDGDFLALANAPGGVPAADHRGDPQLARDDGRVAGAAAAVGDDGGGALHDRLPVRIGHVRHQHVAGLHARHLGGVADDARRAAADALADGCGPVTSTCERLLSA